MEQEFITLEGQLQDLMKQKKKAHARLEAAETEKEAARAEIAHIAATTAEVTTQLGKLSSKEAKVYGNGVSKSAWQHKK